MYNIFRLLPKRGFTSRSMSANKQEYSAEKKGWREQAPVQKKNVLAFLTKNSLLNHQTRSVKTGFKTLLFDQRRQKANGHGGSKIFSKPQSIYPTAFHTQKRSALLFHPSHLLTRAPSVFDGYQAYRFYSFLPDQPQQIASQEGENDKLTPPWMAFAATLCLLLLFALIYQMKDSLVSADAKEGDDLEQLMNAVIALSARGDNAGALEILTAYMKQHPQAAHLWALYEVRGNVHYVNGDLDRALKDYDTALSLHPENSSAFNNRGLIWHNKGDLEKALSDFDAALCINPNYAEALNNRGNVWRAKGDIDKALKDYDVALVINPKDGEVFNNRGNVWREKGDLDKALLDYSAALERKPMFDEALNNRGVIFHERGNLDKALSDFNAALMINPNNDKALSNRGNIWRAKGELDKALADYTMALCINPGSTKTLSNRGFVWRVKGELDKALADFDSALILNPRLAEVYKHREIIWKEKGDMDKALADYNEALSIEPDLATVLTRRGESWQAKGQLDRALSDYNEALAINPHSAAALNYRGLIWQAKGDLEKALKDYDAALAINPEDAEVFCNRGNVWRAKGDLEKALKDFDTALALNPKDDKSYTNRGNAWRAKGDVEKALSDYNVALKHNPKNDSAFNNRGLLWRSKGDLEKALSDFDAALAMNPEDAEVLNNRGTVWHDKGDLEKALSDFDKALAVNQQNDAAFYHRGNIWQEKGELDQALSDYDAALSLNAKNDEVFVQRGTVWSAKGNLDKALSDYNAALSLNPNSATALVGRGNIWSKKGELDKALKDYNAVLAIKPGAVEASTGAPPGNSVGVFVSEGVQGNLPKARSASFALNQDLATTLRQRGNVQKEKGDLNGALQSYNAVLDVNPLDEKSLTYRGAIWGVQGNLNRALADYNAALEIQPDYEQALVSRGMVWHKKNKLAKAREDYERALMINPDNVKALVNHALVCMSLGDLDRATQDHDHLSSLSEESETAREFIEKQRRLKNISRSSLFVFRKKPRAVYQWSDAQPLQRLRKKQVQIQRRKRHAEEQRLMPLIIKGDAFSVREEVDRGANINQPKIIIHDDWLSYKTPIREATEQWCHNGKDERRYDILKVLVKNRCISHACFDLEMLNKLIERGSKRYPKNIGQSRDVICEFFTRSLAVEKEAAINLEISNLLGRNWSDIYTSARKNLAILVPHSNGIFIGLKKRPGYADSLGWKIRDSLLLRFKAYYLLMMAYEQMTSTPETEKELALLKEEAVILQNLFRDTEVTLMLRSISKERVAAQLLYHHAKNLVHRIQQTENKEYVVWSGYEGHSIFVDIIKAGEGEEEKFYPKINNLGAGVFRHQNHRVDERTLYFPCLLTAQGLNKQELEEYLETLLKVRTDRTINRKKALNKIYAGVTQCVDHRSKKTGLTSALKKHTENWEAERKQQTTSCLLRSYAVSSKSRLNKSLKSPGFFKSVEDGHLKMRDFLDKYGLN
jgi:tetratricopeptide (TPR) repeat protein